MSSLEQLKTKLAELTYLSQAAGVLGWDQHTYMPQGAAESRSLQEAALQSVVHEKSISTEMGRLLDGSEREVESLDHDSVDYLLVRMFRYDFEHLRKLPTDFVNEDVQTTSMAQSVWAEARKNDDYKKFAPWLQKNIDIAKRKVEYLGYQDQPYDALLDLYEPKFTTREVSELFSQVRPVVVKLVKDIVDSGVEIDTSIISSPGAFPEGAQEAFGKSIVDDFGYDFNRGRLDRTVHPFASSFSKDDCRITTRYDSSFVQMALMGTFHESGHAMYEQNTGDDLRGSPMAGGCSNSVHESQSRLWENLVGRSQGFWSRYFMVFQKAFPDAPAHTSATELYHAFNKVEPSLIRVEADEVTYNLHIILRFEMEQELLEGKLSVADAPEAWNAKMQAYLGITPPNAKEGILQDIHWAMGGMGYFPTYSLGNFLSAQLFDTMRDEIPTIDDQIAAGEFKNLFNWLESHVWRYGRRYFPQEQITKATGRTLETGPYINYLTKKFSEIYAL